LGVIVIAMADFGDYSNNPLWTDITHLDHLSPQPGFGYQWNRESGRWEPDQTNLYLHGVSGLIGVSNEWLSGISGVLSNEIKIGVDLDADTETHRLLSGISGSLVADDDLDIETHRILSGISGQLSDIAGQSLVSGSVLVSGDVGLDRSETQQWKLVTKTVNQHIEEDFILLEMPDSIRYEDTGRYYGTSVDIMDDIYGTYWNNGRRNPSDPETGHFFVLHEVGDARDKQRKHTFDTDTQFAFTVEDSYTTGRPLHVHPLTDYNSLYERGLAENVTLINNSIYPIQVHSIPDHLTWQKDSDKLEPFFLMDNQGVSIKNDEASKIFVKRPHVISGYDISYSITYKSTGIHDAIR
jgi:hypothetical protein